MSPFAYPIFEDLVRKPDHDIGIPEFVGTCELAPAFPCCSVITSAAKASSVSSVGIQSPGGAIANGRKPAFTSGRRSSAGSSSNPGGSESAHKSQMVLCGIPAVVAAGCQRPRLELLPRRPPSFDDEMRRAFRTEPDDTPSIPEVAARLPLIGTLIGTIDGVQASTPKIQRLGLA